MKACTNLIKHCSGALLRRIVLSTAGIECLRDLKLESSVIGSPASLVSQLNSNSRPHERSTPAAMIKMHESTKTCRQNKRSENQLQR
jgi:hypothetical protein